MDKKYNENWIVVIGQGFSFEVTHEVKHVLWMCVKPCRFGRRDCRACAAACMHLSSEQQARPFQPLLRIPTLFAGR